MQNQSITLESSLWLTIPQSLTQELKLPTLIYELHIFITNPPSPSEEQIVKSKSGLKWLDDSSKNLKIELRRWSLPNAITHALIKYHKVNISKDAVLSGKVIGL